MCWLFVSSAFTIPPWSRHPVCCCTAANTAVSATVRHLLIQSHEHTHFQPYPPSLHLRRCAHPCSWTVAVTYSRCCHHPDCRSPAQVCLATAVALAATPHPSVNAAAKLISQCHDTPRCLSLLSHSVAVLSRTHHCLRSVR